MLTTLFLISLFVTSVRWSVRHSAITQTELKEIITNEDSLHVFHVHVRARVWSAGKAIGIRGVVRVADTAYMKRIIADMCLFSASFD